MKNMSSSVGKMDSQVNGKIKNVPNHHLDNDRNTMFTNNLEISYQIMSYENGPVEIVDLPIKNGGFP